MLQVNNEPYLYDEIGNFTTKGSVSYYYENPDHPSAASRTVDSSGTTNYTWDANGNMATKGNTTYSWDEDNRLVGVDGGTSFTYDYKGRRLKRAASSGVARYPFSDFEIDERGVPKRYLSIGGLRVGVRKGSDDDLSYHWQVKVGHLHAGSLV